MRVDILEKVKARILAEPEHFHMANWAIEVSEDNLGEPWCGTTFCIGGQAAVAMGRNPFYGMPWEPRAYRDLLEMENGNLFFSALWPSRFEIRYNTLSSNKDHVGLAQLACEVIDDYIETNGWTT